MQLTGERSRLANCVRHEKQLRFSMNHPLSRPSATLSPPCGERAGRGVPIWFMASIPARVLEVFPPHELGGTSDIEHPAPNIEWQRESSFTSTFVVRCWTFDVSLGSGGESWREGKLMKNGLLSPALSSFGEGEGEGKRRCARGKLLAKQVLAARVLSPFAKKSFPI